MIIPVEENRIINPRDIYYLRARADRSYHALLVTGYGMDDEFNMYFEAHDCYGVNWGFGGFIRIGTVVIETFVVMDA